MRMLSSLTDFPYVFLVDGRYPDYDYHTDLSDDGTRELAEAFENVVLIDCPASDEVTKRNRYLEACREYGIEYLLIIDSDEYLIERNFTQFIKNLQDYDGSDEILGIQCRYDGVNYGAYPRLWKNPGNWEYYRNHNIFRHRNTGLILRSPPAATVMEGIKMAWDTSLRTAEHEAKTSAYQAKLIAKEKAVKRELFG